MQFLRMRPLPKLLLHCFNLVCAWNFVRTMRHLVVCYILHIFLCLLEPGTMCRNLEPGTMWLNKYAASLWLKHVYA